jgi:hypothetical protein
MNGSIIQSGDEWTIVDYPSLLPDEKLKTSASTLDNDWTEGWNFATDGYRLIEQELKRIRRLRAASRRHQLFSNHTSMDKEDFLAICFDRFGRLPESMRALRPVCEDARENNLRFQAVNASLIVQVSTLTRCFLMKLKILQRFYQTLSLVSVACEAEIRGFDEQKCCQVALATLRTLNAIPKEFIRAFGPQIVCLTISFKLLTTLNLLSKFNHICGLMSLMTQLMQNFTSWATLSLIRQVL